MKKKNNMDDPNPYIFQFLQRLYHPNEVYDCNNNKSETFTNQLLFHLNDNHVERKK